MDTSTSTFKSTWIQVQVLWVFSKMYLDTSISTFKSTWIQILSTNNDHDHENKNIEILNKLFLPKQQIHITTETSDLKHLHHMHLSVGKL